MISPVLRSNSRRNDVKGRSGTVPGRCCSDCPTCRFVVVWLGPSLSLVLSWSPLTGPMCEISACRDSDHHGTSYPHLHRRRQNPHSRPAPPLLGLVLLGFVLVEDQE